jgi:hypothetical protein
MVINQWMLTGLNGMFSWDSSKNHGDFGGFYPGVNIPKDMENHHGFLFGK